MKINPFIFACFLINVTQSIDFLSNNSNFLPQVFQKQKLQADNDTLKINFDLTHYLYSGQWSPNSPETSQAFLNNGGGKIRLTFRQENQDSPMNTNLILQFLIYNGEYIDQRVVQMLDFNLTEIRKDNLTKLWQGQQNITYTEFEHMKNQDSQTCLVNYSLSVTPQQPDDRFVSSIIPSNPQEIQIHFSLQTLQSCQLPLDIYSLIKWDSTNYQMKQLVFSIIMCIILAIQLQSLNKIILFLSNNMQEAFKISIISIGFMSAMDSFLCINFVYNALDMEFYMFPCAFISGMLFLHEVRLLVLLWQSRFYSQYATQVQARKALIIFIIKLYAAIFVLLTLMYFFENYSIFILLLSLFYITPQIVHTSMRGHKLRLNLLFRLSLITIVRLYLYLYQRGCPKNMYEFQPDYTFCYLITASFCTQLLICLLQIKFGSRFFIPRFCLPKQFNYYQTVQVSPDDSSTYIDDCAICMFKIYENMDNEEFNKESALLKKMKIKIMITPCNHKYHISCLKSWLEVKLECPTCRKECPSLD